MKDVAPHASWNLLNAELDSQKSIGRNWIEHRGRWIEVGAFEFIEFNKPGELTFGF